MLMMLRNTFRNSLGIGPETAMMAVEFFGKLLMDNDLQDWKPGND